MTRFKEGARIDRAIETQNPTELRWALEYAQARERTAATERHRRHWQGVIRRVRSVEDPADEVAEIRRDIRQQRGASRETLARIDELVRRFPKNPDVWVLRGDAIQLGDGSGPALAEARLCYERALSVDPHHREAAEEIRHFVDVHGA